MHSQNTIRNRSLDLELEGAPSFGLLSERLFFVARRGLGDQSPELGRSFPRCSRQGRLQFSILPLVKPDGPASVVGLELAVAVLEVLVDSKYADCEALRDFLRRPTTRHQA